MSKPLPNKGFADLSAIPITHSESVGQVGKNHAGPCTGHHCLQKSDEIGAEVIG